MCYTEMVSETVGSEDIHVTIALCIKHGHGTHLERKQSRVSVLPNPRLCIDNTGLVNATWRSISSLRRVLDLEGFLWVICR